MYDELVFKEVNGCFMLEEDMSIKDKIVCKIKDAKDNMVSTIVSNKRNIGLGLTITYSVVKVIIAVRDLKRRG